MRLAVNKKLVFIGISSVAVIAGLLLVMFIVFDAHREYYPLPFGETELEGVDEGILLSFRRTQPSVSLSNLEKSEDPFDRALYLYLRAMKLNDIQTLKEFAGEGERAQIEKYGERYIELLAESFSRCGVSGIETKYWTKQSEVFYELRCASAKGSMRWLGFVVPQGGSQPVTGAAANLQVMDLLRRIVIRKNKTVFDRGWAKRFVRWARSFTKESTLLEEVEGKEKDFSPAISASVTPLNGMTVLDSVGAADGWAHLVESYRAAFSSSENMATKGPAWLANVPPDKVTSFLSEVKDRRYHFMVSGELRSYFFYSYAKELRDAEPLRMDTVVCAVEGCELLAPGSADSLATIFMKNPEVVLDLANYHDGN